MTFRITYSVLDADMATINQAFDGALAEVRAALGRDIPSWVAGRALEGGDPLASRAPADTRLLLAIGGL